MLRCNFPLSDLPTGHTYPTKFIHCNHIPLYMCTRVDPDVFRVGGQHARLVVPTGLNLHHSLAPSLGGYTWKNLMQGVPSHPDPPLKSTHERAPIPLGAPLVHLIYFFKSILLLSIIQYISVRVQTRMCKLPPVCRKSRLENLAYKRPAHVPHNWHY